MSWRALLDPDIRTFIANNIKADIAQLALSKSVPEPRALILDQIKSRQKAALKNPAWLTHNDIILPPPSIIEQASSFATATFKANLFTGQSFADLTGGTGSDTIALSQKFNHGHCVERNESLASLLEHNLPRLSTTPIQIHCASAEEFIRAMPNIDLTFIDPQRRTDKQRGLYKLEDCSPNVITLLPHLQDKTQTIMIKTSPMLDITTGIHTLQWVTDIYAIDYQGDCKELLFILKPNQPTPKTPIIHAITLNDDGSIKYHTQSYTEKTPLTYSPPLTYLFEPSPALQKTGLWAETIKKHPEIKKIAPKTNLFTSEKPINNFQGRIFTIKQQLQANKKTIPFKKANLTTRNFPETTENLKKKLGIKDGGQEYLFACTLNTNKKTIIHCRKA